ncbi:hypothetical protein [Streptomyces sp. NPDC086776]|uniref:hypothetical protein n=1 Tax=Streptomyces sp. NPDC086776 TaxID=3365756 RepID=UPI0038110F85
MTLPTACGCLVEALAALAAGPTTSPGLACICPSHTQVIVWDGACWRWSNQPADTAMALDQPAAPTPDAT